LNRNLYFLIRLGSRRSPLALRQSIMVKKLINYFYPKYFIEIVPFITYGDRITDTSLSELGGKGLFTQEIGDSICCGYIDGAIHSMKDVPTNISNYTCIAAVLNREDPRDVIISFDNSSTIYSLKKKLHIGTSSLRRKSQLLYFRPDLKISTIRGNIDTRINRVRIKEFGATILAIAGLNRLGRETNNFLPQEDMLPAVGQGIIGIECRIDDISFKNILSKANSTSTMIELKAERSFLSSLDTTCYNAVAANASLDHDLLKLEGLVASSDGKFLYRYTNLCSKRDPIRLGVSIALIIIKIIGMKKLYIWRKNLS
jgi:hydroxymethylbilane synthase